MIKQALTVLGTLAMFVALPASSLAQAQATGAPLRVDHYVRTKSTVPAMNGQIANLYVRERVRPEVALRGNLTQGSDE